MNTGRGGVSGAVGWGKIGLGEFPRLSVSLVVGCHGFWPGFGLAFRSNWGVGSYFLLPEVLL